MFCCMTAFMFEQLPVFAYLFYILMNSFFFLSIYIHYLPFYHHLSNCLSLHLSSFHLHYLPRHPLLNFSSTFFFQIVSLSTYLSNSLSVVFIVYHSECLLQFFVIHSSKSINVPYVTVIIKLFITVKLLTFVIVKYLISLLFYVSV